MSLTPEQKRLREGKVTASFAPYLMAGKEERIRSEWCSLVGYPGVIEPQFDPWRSKYADAIEPLALDHHEEKTGLALIRRGEVVVHPIRDYVACTLDSYRAEDSCVIDCKAWSVWQKIDYICSFLAPQMIVQKACVGARAAALLIVHGGAEPVEYPISWEPEYEAQVWERVEWFWNCIKSLTPPVALPTIDPPVIAVKTYDMKTSNAWAEQAAIWLRDRGAAKSFDAAAAELKTLMPPAAKLAFGHGIEISKAKNGAKTITEHKA
jgi:predicted phage-related endonuclease